MHITKSGLPSVKSGIPINSTPYWTDQVGRFPAGDYAIEYDSRGRIKKDETRGIESIRYQPFDNLPYKIEMTNGSSTTSNYFTDGKLHSRVHSTPTIQTITHITASGDTIVKSRPSIQTTRTEYFGNFERSGYNYRYNTPQGYYDLSNNQHYWFQRDRLGSTVAVYDSAANMLQTTAYYPSGTPHQLQSSSVSTKVDALTDQLHIGNHWLSHAGLNLYDNTARLHDPLLMHFGAPDPLYSDYPGNSPWSHCGGDPINYTDKTGLWYVKVHLKNDRSVDGSGIAITYDKNGNELFRFTVRAEGVNGRNRMKENSDTPLGIYTIDSPKTWEKKCNRLSYGPNEVLRMSPKSGEIVKSNRSGILIHGGRQETQSNDGQWHPHKSPVLKKTKGCLRAYDDDMKTLKTVTDELTKADPTDTPQTVEVLDDLDQFNREAQQKNINKAE